MSTGVESTAAHDLTGRLAGKVELITGACGNFCETIV
jgi:hypothetical protein